MSSNSVCNHTRDKQIGLPLRSSDFVITRMITDRIGLHSVLLPLLIAIIIIVIVVNNDTIVVIVHCYCYCYNRTYNKILDRDWFSARLFVT